MNSPGDFYTYDAAGRNVAVESSSSTATLGLDGDGRQVKTAETVWDEPSQSFVTETRYYLRSSMLGGQVLTEVEADGCQSRTFVYAGPAVLAWQYGNCGMQVASLWEHRDPCEASFRTTVAETPSISDEQELDPVGADKGVVNQSIIPDEGALAPYVSSYNPEHPNMSYSIDGVRVSLDEFMGMVLFAFKDNFGLLEASARASSRPVGYRNSGVSWGRRFEVIYDANGRVQSVNWGDLDPNLRGVNYGVESPIYDSSWALNVTLLPQNTFDFQRIHDLLRQTVTRLPAQRS